MGGRSARGVALATRRPDTSRQHPKGQRIDDNLERYARHRLRVSIDATILTIIAIHPDQPSRQHGTLQSATEQAGTAGSTHPDLERDQGRGLSRTRGVRCEPRAQETKNKKGVRGSETRRGGGGKGTGASVAGAPGDCQTSKETRGRRSRAAATGVWSPALWYQGRCPRRSQGYRWLRSKRRRRERGSGGGRGERGDGGRGEKTRVSTGAH